MEVNILIAVAAGFLSGDISDRILKKYPEEELRVNIRFPIIQILNSLTYLLLYLRHGYTLRGLSYMFLSSLLIWISAMDIHKYTIPNGAILIGLAGGSAVYGISAVIGEGSRWDPVAGMVIGPAFFLITALIAFFITGREELGGGDIKLMAPVGFLLGVKLTVLTVLISVITAGFTSAVLYLTKLKKREDVIPFGPFIALSALIAAVFGEDMIKWYLRYIFL